MDLHPSVSPFMRMALDSEQCLYSNIQNVVMPNGKTRDLRIEISGFGKPISKVEVRMTDDSDPSLLYILHVSESDFNAIKSQQGLLVDFSNFPIHLVKLIEQCLNSVKGFLLILEEHGLEGYLKVVQPIDLKNLCYLALRIARGSDTEIMRHMHNQITLLKKKLISKEEECTRIQSQIVQLQQEVNLREQQIEEQLRNFEEDKTKLQARFSKEMDMLRDQLLQDRRRDLDSAAYQHKSLSTKIEDLTREASKYKNKHNQVCEKYEEAQQTIRELSMRISSSEDMQKSMSKEIADLRRHKAELESEFRKKDQDLDQSRSHADALDKEVARLRTRLSRQEGQLKQADAEQVKMKSALTRLQETIEARSDLVLQLNGDLTKANLIIKERQKDLDKVHSEFQKLAALKHDEETKFKNLELEMKLLRANADRDEARIKALEETEKQLKEQLKTANEAISAKDQQHKKCGELISYLNRSLNRQHLDPSPPSTSHGGNGPSTLYNSAPSAPILYTLGSSLGRAGAQAALHVSGPPLSNQGANIAVNALPFSSTPLVASTAAGGTGFVGPNRRSYPGALIHPSVQFQGSGILTETPAARPVVDRLTMSQVQAKEDLVSKKNSQPSSHPSQTQNHPKTMTKSKSHSAIGSTSNLGSKEKRSERGTKGKGLDKENKEDTAYKPSAYFHPNKIITEF